MARVRAADDFEAIRSRLEELRRERAQLLSGGSANRSPTPEPDAIADRLFPVRRRLLSPEVCTYVLL
jgi:hypothetical protein